MRARAFKLILINFAILFFIFFLLFSILSKKIDIISFTQGFNETKNIVDKTVEFLFFLYLFLPVIAIGSCVLTLFCGFPDEVIYLYKHEKINTPLSVQIIFIFILLALIILLQEYAIPKAIWKNIQKQGPKNLLLFLGSENELMSIGEVRWDNKNQNWLLINVVVLDNSSKKRYEYQWARFIPKEKAFIFSSGYKKNVNFSFEPLLKQSYRILHSFNILESAEIFPSLKLMNVSTNWISFNIAYKIFYPISFLIQALLWVIVVWTNRYRRKSLVSYVVSVVLIFFVSLVWLLSVSWFNYVLQYFLLPV